MAKSYTAAIAAVARGRVCILCRGGDCLGISEARCTARALLGRARRLAEGSRDPSWIPAVLGRVVRKAQHRQWCRFVRKVRRALVAHDETCGQGVGAAGPEKRLCVLSEVPFEVVAREHTRDGLRTVKVVGRDSKGAFTLRFVHKFCAKCRALTVRGIGSHRRNLYAMLCCCGAYVSVDAKILRVGSGTSCMFPVGDTRAELDKRAILLAH